MITKITRRQLRRLINEALKPFFMAVPPTDIIDRLLKDDTIDHPLFPKIKELLSHPDPETQRHALNLLQSAVPEIGKRYPELSSYDISDPVGAPDLTHRSQPAYKEEFEYAQQRAIHLQKTLPFRELINNLLNDSGLRSGLDNLVIETAMNERLNRPQGMIVSTNPDQLRRFKEYLDAEGGMKVRTWPEDIGPHMASSHPGSNTPSSSIFSFFVLPA